MDSQDFGAEVGKSEELYFYGACGQLDARRERDRQHEGSRREREREEAEMSSDVMAKNQGSTCAMPVQDGPVGPDGPPRKRRRKRYASQRAGGPVRAPGVVGPALPAGDRRSSRAPAAGRCGCRLSASSGPVAGPMAVETGDSVIRQAAAVEDG
ncbi:hypothetical protein Slala02_15050 [Streptomyces lavendulae subsp. lavendulae]|nr:hypothetical protein Slala01_46750 [Streptomyces lavendulae subsp. lavendulae]GLX25685.1 hypothetical protein Slala02_15050 [Streptomyces lavendulae subsp. lavendulae]